MTPARRGREGARFSPVIIERAGGGLARVADEPAPFQALRGLVREGAEILGAERTSIWRMGPVGMPLRCLTRFHRSSATHEDDLAYPDELGRETWRLLERLSVLAMDDVRAAPSPTPVFRNYLQEAGIRAILAIPLRHDGNVAGYLAFEETEGPRPWTPRDRSQAATLAFRLERHWGRVGTSVGPGASQTPGSGRGGAPAPPAAAPLPPSRRRSEGENQAPSIYRERAGGEVEAGDPPNLPEGVPAAPEGPPREGAPQGAPGTPVQPAPDRAPTGTTAPPDGRGNLPTHRPSGLGGTRNGVREELVAERLAETRPGGPESGEPPGERRRENRDILTNAPNGDTKVGSSGPPSPVPMGEGREEAMAQAPALAAASAPSLAASPPAAGISTAGPEGGLPPRTTSFGHRRELRARLQRLRTLERTGILGTRTAREALHWLDVQEGTLALLEAHLREDGGGRDLLHDAREALDRARDELVRHLGWARKGLEAPEGMELNTLVGRIAVRLGKLTGERVGLLYAPASEAVWTTGDPHLLERALEELVRNARSASAPGDRVRIGVQRAELPGNRRVARLLVEDRGVGIDPSNLPWIFEPWFSTRGDEADGYGLPYVQAVVEGHGGWVDVTSTEGRGSVFALNLPLLDAVREDAAQGEEAESRASASGTPSRPVALVVEDDELTARLLRNALEGGGFRVLLSGGGSESMRMVREEGPAASVLLVERVLADGTEGVDLLRAGRALQPYLGGIVLDRRLRAGGDPHALLRVREWSEIPSDVALVPAPFHPASLLAEARRLSARSLEARTEASPSEAEVEASASRPGAPTPDADTLH